MHTASGSTLRHSAASPACWCPEVQRSVTARPPASRAACAPLMRMSQVKD
jgi:hypothetical protein